MLLESVTLSSFVRAKGAVLAFDHRERTGKVKSLFFVMAKSNDDCFYEGQTMCLPMCLRVCGLSERQGSRKLGIPKTTVHRWVIECFFTLNGSWIRSEEEDKFSIRSVDHFT